MEEKLFGVDVRSSDGTWTKVVRPNREPFDLDGVRYVLTGNRHGVFGSMYETAIPAGAYAA